MARVEVQSGHVTQSLEHYDNPVEQNEIANEILGNILVGKEIVRADMILREDESAIVVGQKAELSLSQSRLAERDRLIDQGKREITSAAKSAIQQLFPRHGDLDLGRWSGQTFPLGDPELLPKVIILMSEAGWLKGEYSDIVRCAELYKNLTPGSTVGIRQLDGSLRVDTLYVPSGYAISYEPGTDDATLTYGLRLEADQSHAEQVPPTHIINGVEDIETYFYDEMDKKRPRKDGIDIRATLLALADSMLKATVTEHVPMTAKLKRTIKHEVELSFAEIQRILDSREDFSTFPPFSDVARILIELDKKRIEKLTDATLYRVLNDPMANRSSAFQNVAAIYLQDPSLAPLASSEFRLKEAGHAVYVRAEAIKEKMKRSEARAAKA